MIQDRKSHGEEGGLAPAQTEGHSKSGGKPPFPTGETFRLASFLSTLVIL